MSKIKNEYDCSLILTHDLIGGKWKLRILWHIVHGDNRFSELRKCIPDITEKVLYTNLRELEDSGIIHRVSCDAKPVAAVMYFLHERYNKLAALVDGICDFSESYAMNNNIVLTKK